MTQSISIEVPEEFLTQEYVFGESNPNWTRNEDQNAMFLKVNENFANDLLSARGILLLNDILDNLGYERTDLGAVTGWLKDEGEGYITLNAEARGDHFVLKPNIQGLVFHHYINALT